MTQKEPLKQFAAKYHLYKFRVSKTSRKVKRCGTFHRLERVETFNDHNASSWRLQFNFYAISSGARFGDSSFNCYTSINEKTCKLQQPTMENR
ncbi:predicted protein [Botrytis cinerea T4]|uniref:Uncharacterized protein n=1 Tax=Botryotinia fuckeliana (strain T4) TaxID=999810 RepID=G2XSK4_BOTF4|nr:predicted protein [Botrytis cinerea T4]